MFGGKRGQEKRETHITVSPRWSFFKGGKPMTLSDKTAHYGLKKIFRDEAPQLENNNHDNGLLLCSVTQLNRLNKKREKKERRSHALDVTGLRLASI